MIPRSIHGTVVYQTESEDLKLTAVEDSSVAVFVIGLVTGLVYLRRWGLTNALNDEEEIIEAETK